ncbi:MAG TPA: DUF885 domain-containing protein [Cyclobacteriaceae bacterium]|jgi:uncharacterized protein (DUF885 family)
MMKTHFLFLALFLFAMISCNSPETRQADYAALMDTLMADYHEDYLRLNPVEATLSGDTRYNDTLHNDISVAFREELRKFYQDYKDRLATIDRNALDEEDQLSYDIIAWNCDLGLERLKFNEHLMPLNQFWSLPLMVGQLASGASFQPFATVKDYENWLSRLDDYIVWCDTAIVNMRKGMAEGYVLPKVLAQRVIPQLREFDHGPVANHLFYAPIKKLPESFSQEDKQRITQAYEEMVSQKIIPMHKRLADFVEKEYLPACRETAGISEIPNGREYYQFLIKYYTTTDMTADEVFELGQREVERITKEMEAVMKQTGFNGNLKAFFDHLRSRKELMPFKTADEVINNFNAIHERMKPHLDRLFDKKPKTPFEVRRTEAFREASASAEYNPGSLDGTRPGIFYVPVPEPKEYNVLMDEDLFLHEAIPGHHYQISLQQENDSLPEFRKLLGNSAYIEGWALYAESLGKELGLYTDPYQYFGMLSGEMHRAIRLVVDAGMHTQGWTREQAIQYSLDHEAETEASIIAEIERYMAIPGQALSYKVGQLKIRELRTRAEEAFGENFDIGEFHNKVLESGTVPLNLLEEKIDRWIESSRQ